VTVACENRPDIPFAPKEAVTDNYRTILRKFEHFLAIQSAQTTEDRLTRIGKTSTFNNLQGYVGLPSTCNDTEGGTIAD